MKRPKSLTGPIAIVVGLAGVLAVGAGLSEHGGLWDRPASGSKPPPREFPVLEPSQPIRIAIPSIDVRAPVHGVGLADDGSISVPSVHRHNEAGWFDRGPTPGEFGPAIIVGHADTKDGPSIFYSLPKLKAGDRIEVTRRDRSVAIFEVNSVERFGKAKLPADRVYSDYTRPALRLITCGGRWVGGSIGYADNIVAFASLVETKDA
ncbi:class F sortase [Phytohabitans rumicis]|uniref:Class F sortase n=1 Tax=Phytohabitans rumicis TaxID=1076125 RepID=A0A6V8LDV7_9ACTN|nr:class F sortase [Phytohabitans rumicis]